ncbi:hypothetical protein CYMTET_39578 [Cymbomonas tetramitiformis]|uniref:Uncharacterized protein n=1 Tax=Cymbomonas tetramitiformis TaxID=36881 RepID=A0AAE0CBI2_9CHLO|nr:hypothetical protein CYMTET_39578 [Cymbomonas tetramitiformis]
MRGCATDIRRPSSGYPPNLYFDVETAMPTEESKAYATESPHSFGSAKNIVQADTLKRQQQGFAACAFLQHFQEHTQRFRAKIKAGSKPEEVCLSHQRQTDNHSPWHEVRIMFHTQRVQCRKRKLRKELNRLEEELESLRHEKLTSNKAHSCPQMLGLAGVAGICGTATTISLGAAAVIRAPNKYANAGGG